VQLAREIGLDAGLLLGNSEEAGGGRTRASALEDAFEAVIGALYLDSDLATTSAWSWRFTVPSRNDSPAPRPTIPRAGSRSSSSPVMATRPCVYEVTRTEGADHARAYEVSVFLLSRHLGTGRGTSKKLAEEAAARRGAENTSKRGDDS